MTRHEPADGASLIRHEEELEVGTRTTQVTLRKDVEIHAVEDVVPVGIERADIERTVPTYEDSGQIETLPDGTISVPIFEEEIVVTKRLRVRERILIKTTTETHDEVVHDEVRRERVEVLATGAADVANED